MTLIGPSLHAGIFLDNVKKARVMPIPNESDKFNIIKQGCS